MLALLLACAPAGHGPSDWLDGTGPGGPCYAVDLLDGLDESSTQELHDAFTCLNREGALQPFADTVDSLDGLTREDEPAGLPLARAVNRLPEADLSLASVLQTSLELLESGELTWLAELAAELLYGRPFDQLDELDLAAASSLEGGLVRPLLPALHHVAGATLDDDLEALEPLGQALVDRRLLRAVHSAAALSRDPTWGDTVRDLPEHLGDAIERARSPQNDRWAEASGDSLRDLADKLLVETGGDGRPAIEHMADPARVLFEDEQVGARLETVLDRLEREDRLRALPPQLLYLAEVDVEGGSLEADEDSALVALLRLVRRGNTELDCSIDLVITELDLIHIDNVSVALLSAMAELDPEDAQGGVDLLGDVLGTSLSRSVLYAIADEGICDPLDRQMVDDLESIDRLTDPVESDLLVSLLLVLQALHQVDTSRIPELVDLIATVHAFEADRALEEVLRDVGTARLIYDVFELLPPLLDGDPGTLPEGVQAFDFEAVWTVLRDVARLDGQGRSMIEQLAPLLQTALVDEGTWQVVGNLGALLQEDSARLAELPERFPTWVEADPELGLLDTLGGALSEPELARELLLILDTDEVIEALARAQVLEEGPLPFLGRLIVGGTLSELLEFVQWGVDLMRGE